MPTITLAEGMHAAGCAELATWTMPAWRATGTEAIETTEQGSRRPPPEDTPKNGIVIDATAPLDHVVDEIVRRAKAIDSTADLA
jgi:hypothetical protein